MLKNLFYVCIVTLSLLFLFSCAQEAESTKMIIREATNVPNLITPGVWDGQAFSLNASIYDFLVEIDYDSWELTPALATEWNSENGKTWTIKLREGVTFHDGTDFTSEDVKFTIERTQDPAIGHLQKNDFSIVTGIETPDDYTIIIQLAEVRPTFMYLLTAYNMAILSSEYDYASKGESHPMGTGPFFVQTMVPKESAHLIKNESYWAAGLPKADELLLYFVPDVDSSVAMLMADDVDVTPFITTIHKNQLEEKGFKVLTPYQEHRFIALSADRPPFDDNRVRLAVKYSIDPEIIAKVAHGQLGHDVYYNETPVMDIHPQYSERPHRKRNIEKAKELLAEAGHPDGITVELYYGSDHPYGQELAQALKELTAPAGINIELKGYPRDVYLTQYWMNAQMLLTGWGPRIDPSMLLMLAYHSEGPWNESHINDAEVDELISKINAEVDPGLRKQYYKELQEIFYVRGTILNIQVPYYVAMKDNVRDYRQPPTFMTQYKYTYIE